MSKIKRVNRPDIEEYHTECKAGQLEIWWDDQPGAEEGWCVRLITRDAYGREQEQDIPCKGRRKIKPETLRRNALAAIH